MCKVEVICDVRNCFLGTDNTASQTCFLYRTNASPSSENRCWTYFFVCCTQRAAAAGESRIHSTTIFLWRFTRFTWKSGIPSGIEKLWIVLFDDLAFGNWVESVAKDEAFIHYIIIHSKTRHRVHTKSRVIQRSKRVILFPQDCTDPNFARFFFAQNFKLMFSKMFVETNMENWICSS